MEEEYSFTHKEWPPVNVHSGPPDCVKCKYRTDVGLGWRCAAFPDGIPSEIIDNLVKHKKVLPGQVGKYVFKRRYFF